MRAGELRQRVIIQQNVPRRDNFGAEIETWLDLATVWAAIEPVSGAEQFVSQADQVQASRLTRIRIRQRAGLDNTKLQVVFGERVFDIQSVAYDPTQKREIILTGQERGV